MPTVILLDVSLSMAQPVELADTADIVTKQWLSVYGINTLLDNFSVTNKLEFVAVVAFSSVAHTICNFTRDFEYIKQKLLLIEELDKTSVEVGLNGVNELVLSEWGRSTPCQIILITDCSPGFGNLSLKHSISTLSKRTPATPFPLPFLFPSKLSVMCIGGADDPAVRCGLPLYHQLVELAGLGSTLYIPDMPLSLKGITSIFERALQVNFTPFQATLRCGSLYSHVTLCPTPQPYHKVTDFESIRGCISNTINICGFIETKYIGSPLGVSRHLILPHPAKHEDVVRIDADSEDEVVIDEGYSPSFCVLLHGALKVEMMAAICLLQEEWYGIVFCWADSKKRSNLMLTVLEPGSKPIPWLGDMKNLGTAEDFLAINGNSPPVEPFPVRPGEKRSYSQNYVVWILESGIHSDIQKILRQARKLPDKLNQFYKELNRVRKAALSIGFIELIDGLASVFERECTLLPGTVHPDCAIQLSYVANTLRKQQGKDFKTLICPLKTKFGSTDS